jgi:SAM-dependent methyltransferase
MQAQEPSLETRWDALAGALTRYRDVLDGRVLDETVPAALRMRGWDEALLELSEDELVAMEIAGCDGEPYERFPPTLVELHRSSAELCSVPALLDAPEPTRRPLRRLETPRKRAQVDALSRLTLPFAREAARVIEVGSGHGHLARDVAEQIEVPVLGLERNAAISAKARNLASSGRLSFVEVDVLRDGLGLQEGDCALGLHACGELGDALVVGVAERARSLVLVGCCLQKQRAEARLSLNGERAGAGETALPKSLLGLSNFTPREQGVEATRAENVAAFERRLALHALLSSAAGPLRFGVEMDGLNRRAAHGELGAMVERAFRLRGLPAPPQQAIDDAQRTANRLHGHIRRLSLPRVLLGRVLEMFVFVDRALYLESAGFTVTIGTAFPKEISARNLTLLARRRGRHDHDVAQEE